MSTAQQDTLMWVVSNNTRGIYGNHVISAFSTQRIAEEYARSIVKACQQNTPIDLTREEVYNPHTNKGLCLLIHYGWCNIYRVYVTCVTLKD